MVKLDESNELCTFQYIFDEIVRHTFKEDVANNPDLKNYFQWNENFQNTKFTHVLANVKQNLKARKLAHDWKVHASFPVQQINAGIMTSAFKV